MTPTPPRSTLFPYTTLFRSIMSTFTVKRVEKPWGYEIWWAKTDRYVGKILHVNAGHALSLQYHNIKDETIHLYSGRLLYEDRKSTRLNSITVKSRMPSSA